MPRNLRFNSGLALLIVLNLTKRWFRHLLRLKILKLASFGYLSPLLNDNILRGSTHILGLSKDLLHFIDFHARPVFQRIEMPIRRSLLNLRALFQPFSDLTGLVELLLLFIG